MVSHVTSLPSSDIGVVLADNGSRLLVGLLKACSRANAARQASTTT
jgi:hypothetical protein